MFPKFDLDKIKFRIDAPTWERAVELYENGKVRKFKTSFGGYEAVVEGGQRYNVFVSSRSYNEGSCDCYLGQKETLCKHMVAVALFALMGGKTLNDNERKLQNELIFSGRSSKLEKTELVRVKKSISESVRYIKPYNGPSRIWFSYQNSLTEGCNRLSAIFSNLPACRQTAELIINTLLRLDKKLCTGGVDDSDGTIGGFIEKSVHLLSEFARYNPNCADAFVKLKNKETCFGWEEPLLKKCPISVKKTEFV